LEAQLTKLIPTDSDINKIVDDTEVLITAWDLNSRSPRFFTKWSYETSAKDFTDAVTKEDKVKAAMHDSKMTLGKMTLASASTPYYFTPATI